MPNAADLAFGPGRNGAGARQHLGHGARTPNPRHQRDLCLGGRRRRLDGRDDVVDIRQRYRQTFQYVAAFARLAQFEHRAAGDHFPAMPQEGVEHLLQAQQARLAVDQGDHVDAEHGLHGRLREQIIQQDLGGFAALQLDDDAHAVLVRLVAQAVRSDALDELVPHQVGDALDQPRLVHLVGKLGDDDGLAVALADFLEVGARTHVQPAAAGLVGGDDLLRAVDQAGGGEIRSRHDLHQLPEGDVGILDQRNAGADDLGEIVRRYVGRHAHRDSGGAVDQQIRHPRRQHRRFAFRLVVVRYEIDRFLVDVRQQLAGNSRHAHFGVAHGRRRVAVDRAEIALAVHQQVAHGEGLRHAYDGVVHRGVAVRVIFADDVADHTGRLLVRLVPVIAQFAHGVEHAPMHGFQAVADIGQCPADDDAHCVIQIGFAHLVFEIYGQYFASDLGHLRESGAAFAALLSGFKGGETWSQHGGILAHIRPGACLKLMERPSGPEPAAPISRYTWECPLFLPIYASRPAGSCP